MVGKDRGTRKRKSVQKDDAPDKKKKKLINSKKNEDDLTPHISEMKKKLRCSTKNDNLTRERPKRATISKKKKTLMCSKKNDKKKLTCSKKRSNLTPKRATISKKKKNLTTDAVKTTTISKKKKNLTTDAVKTTTVSKKRQKQRQKTTNLGTKTGSPTRRVKPQLDSVKAVNKKKPKKKALPQGRKKGIGPQGVQKKKKKELDECCYKAKRLWEKGRRIDCTTELQTTLIDEVYACLAGRIPEVIFSHDMSRVIQWLIRHSTAERVAEIVSECAPVLVRMFQSKYSKYCVQVLIKHRSEIVKKLIIENLFGNIVTLATHPIAAPLLGEAYERCANNLLRNRMKQELYSSLFTKQKSDKIKDLRGMFQTYPELKDSTLKGMNNMFTNVFDGNLQKSSLIHDVLLDFLEVCPEKMGGDVSLRVLHLADHFVTTKNGVMVLLKSFSLTTEAERKQFIVNMSQLVPKLACSDSGHFLLISLLTYVDDISLMEKTILRAIAYQLPEIASHVHGSKVLLDIISTMKLPELPPKLTRMLNFDLDRLKVHRKKETLLKAMLSPFLHSVSCEPDIWLADGPISVATYNILQCGKGAELIAAFESLAKHVALSKSTIKHHGKEYTVVEHPGVHKILKKMIDYDPLSTQEVKSSFGSALVKQVTVTTIRRWLESSRGCFMLSFLLKKFADPKLKNMVQEELLDRQVKAKVKTFTGGAVLLEMFKRK